MNMVSTWACAVLFRGLQSQIRSLIKLPGNHGDFIKEVTFETCTAEIFLAGKRVGPF